MQGKARKAVDLLQPLLDGDVACDFLRVSSCTCRSTDNDTGLCAVSGPWTGEGPDH